MGSARPESKILGSYEELSVVGRGNFGEALLVTPGLLFPRIRSEA